MCPPGVAPVPAKLNPCAPLAGATGVAGTAEVGAAKAGAAKAGALAAAVELAAAEAANVAVGNENAGADAGVDVVPAAGVLAAPKLRPA